MECHASRNLRSDTWRAYIKIKGFDGAEHVPWEKYNYNPYDDIIHGGVTALFGDDWGMDFHHQYDYAPLEPHTHTEQHTYWNFPDAKKEVIKMVWLAYGPHVSVVSLAKFENCHAETIGDSCSPDRCWVFKTDTDTARSATSGPGVSNTGHNSISD